MAWIGIAPVLATIIRRGTVEGIGNAAPHWLLGIGIGLALYPLFRIDNILLAYFSLRDARRILGYACLIALLASFGTFLFDRMEDVARSEPLIQIVILFAGLVGTRLFAQRLLYRDRRDHHAVAWDQQKNALILGVNEVSDAYLRLMERVGHPSTRIVGLLSATPMVRGLSQRGCEIAGTIRDLPELLTRFEVHGLRISALILAEPAAALAGPTALLVRRLEREGIEVQRLDALSALVDTRLPTHPHLASRPRRILGTWPGKRAMDMLVAAGALLLVAPLLALVAGLVLIDLGPPVIFWQVRPGLHGRPVRFFKIRTMRAPTDARGRLLDDAERATLLGNVLRRSHIDELPQLFNVLVGDMSLVGPRPLLPRDLPANSGLRALMRPGLTGWAQVNGGKLVSPEDKVALDMWYAHHASLWLDLRILVQTVLRSALGDRPSAPAVYQAREHIAHLATAAE